MSEFVHLNVHSHYSVLQGACHLKPLVAQTKELGMDALALTDNANMFASQDFYKVCQGQGIKPIVGMTCYVAGNHKEHRVQDGVRIGKRIVLLAKSHAGYQTLCRISSYAYINGFYFKPRIDHELLKEHHEGLVVLSGGMNSELHDHLKNERFDKAEETIQFYKDLVGAENYFIEMQRTGIEEQDVINPKAEELANKHGLDCVATNDVYYVHQKDNRPHEILMCIGQQKLLNDASRPRFSSDEFYLKSPEQMKELFKDKPEWIANTLKVSELLQLEFPEKAYHLPIFETPDNMPVETFFDQSCIEGLEMRYGKPLTKDVLDRYEIEKGVILRTGFPTYFLIVADFIAKSREMGIPVGPGRGSAAGSIIAYALEITDIDPLRFDLLFERFLNEERVSMPDIDIDFCQERRKEVIEYVVEHYGRDNVAMIATFGTMGAKGVIRDVGRVLNFDLKDVDKICKMIPEGPKIDLKKALEGNYELQNHVDQNQEVKNLFDLAFALEGSVRNIGTHAAGVVISDKDLKEYLPLYKADATISTQFTMTSVEEDCGLLKMDFLGLQNLTVINKAVKLIKENRGIDLNIRSLSLDDPAPYALLQRGETAGIFQFESEGMQNLLKRAMPDTFEDIIALLALYRPGPLGSGMDKVFVECKNGRKAIEYPHALCESELRETYGIILYQEQVMRLANKLAGFNLKEADNLRKAMGKKKIDIMMKFKSKFVDGGVERGIPKEKAEEIFELMLKFAEYGFNKSHSAAYAYVSYQTAYLKAHYPEEFMAALMTCDIRNKDKIAFFREECRKMRIDVLPPHVNESAFDFRVVNGAIRYGLGGGKSIGGPSVDAVVEAREEKGVFTSFDEFIDRIDLSRCGKTAIEAMIKCGALDGLGANRCQMFEGLIASMQMAQSEAKKQEQGQLMLFAVEDSAPGRNLLPDLREWPERDKLAREKEVLGFYVSSHPLASVQDTLLFYSSYAIAQIPDLEDGTEVCIGGIISQSSHRFYKENKKMYRFHFEDLSHSLDCVYFCPEPDRYGHLIEDDRIVFLIGRTGRDRNGDPSLRIQRIVPLEDAEKQLSSSVALHINEDQCEEAKMRQLGKLLKQYHGPTPVFIMLDQSEQTLQFKLEGEYSIHLEKSLLTDLCEMIGPEQIELRRFNKSLLGGKRW